VIKALQLVFISTLCLTASFEVHAVPGFDRLIESARTARSKGKFLKAAQLLLKAYQMNPSTILLNNIGKMYEDSGQYRKAYDAYKKVADDPAAPSNLRPMNISRMNGIASKLSKGHFTIKAPKAIREAYINGKLISREVFSVERSVPLGKIPVEFWQDQSAQVNIAWVLSKAGTRKKLNLGRLKKSMTAKITALDLAGLKSLSINGYDVKRAKCNVVKLKPSTYLLELEFRDGSLYERTVSLKKGSVITLDSFATEFAQVRSPDSQSRNSQFWFKGGAVALGVGLTTAGGLLAMNANAEHQDILSNTDISMLQAQERWTDAQERGDRGVSLMGIGLTALTSGILWFVLDPQQPGQSSAWDWFPSPMIAPAFTHPLTAAPITQVK
jgi:hypothetical protein